MSFLIELTSSCGAEMIRGAVFAMLLASAEGFRPAQPSGSARVQVVMGSRVQGVMDWGARRQWIGDHRPQLLNALPALILGLAVACADPHTAAAVSGGGKDFASAYLRGRDFSQGDYKSKDFSGCDAQDVSFVGSKLVGARFYKADIARADFTSADLTSASLEDTSLDGAVLKDAVLASAYLSQSVEAVKNIAGADFSEAVMRPDVQQRLCKREDATGKNPATGVTTRESLMCPD